MNVSKCEYIGAIIIIVRRMEGLLGRVCRVLGLALLWSQLGDFFKSSESSVLDLLKTSYFNIEIVKAYKKLLTRTIEEGTLIVNFIGEALILKMNGTNPKL